MALGAKFLGVLLFLILVVIAGQLGEAPEIFLSQSHAVIFYKAIISDPVPMLSEALGRCEY